MVVLCRHASAREEAASQLPQHADGPHVALGRNGVARPETCLLLAFLS
jgi:hypothetical protein